jgi:hypothetical protein
MTDPSRRTIRAVGELPQQLPPARDLWPGIAAAIATVPEAAPIDGAATTASAWRPAWACALALAATLACLAVGVWIGRASAPPAPGIAAAFTPDARFGAERQALMVQAALGLAQLPEADRRKLEASLATIRDAIADIRRALGDDPGNRLLQEMLVNSYQDEIRVLTAVQEAGAAGQEI